MRRCSAFVAAWMAAGTALAAPVEPAWSLAQKERPAAIVTMRELVSFESGSRDREGLDRISSLIAGRLSALGASVELIEAGADATRLFDTPEKIGRTVVARFQGTGTKKVMLLAHMDTVYARGTLAKRPFRVEGNRAYGPVVADDKGGIAVILHALNVLKQLNYRDYKTLTVVIN